MEEKVVAYFAKHVDRSDSLDLLRKMALDAGLKETIKWGAPVYTLNGKNVVGLGSFKSYVGLWFFQGALLADKIGNLVNAQEGKTQAMRQWRFESFAEIQEKENHIRAYIEEAAENQRMGRVVKLSKPKPLEFPDVLQDYFSNNPFFQEKFEKLSPSYQREYVKYIAEAKRQETRKRHLEKIVPMVEKGQGLNDKYQPK